MAEAVLGVLADHLITEAFSLAANEFSLVWGFKDDLESLGEELETIQGLVVDADRKNVESLFVQRWLKRLKAVALDAEDVLDEYKYELLRKKVPQTKWDKVRNFFFPMRKLALRTKMAHKIKDINFKLKKTNETGEKYGLKPFDFLSRRPSVLVNRITSPSVQEEDIEGRGEDVEKVLEMLLNQDKEHEFAVTGIVGMGGQGKTTLAQLVYKHDVVVKGFEHRMWVCVSEDFKVERLLTEMVQSLKRTNPNLGNREALIKELQKTLKGKRYLLVLDDVWNKDQKEWEDLKKDLQEIGGSKGTKVMVTTRSDEVLLTMQVLATQTHNLGKLSDDDSWTLFKKRAFAEGGVIETSEFSEVGQRIIKRCGGVPLAIKALGGLLYSKKNMSEWQSIEASTNLWSLTNSQEGVLSSIKLSYNHLPSLSLKQCFAYCSMYPKDTLMPREEIVLQWMAQGFLNPLEGSSLQMEELGSDYFDILLWNSLLQEPTYKNEHWCYKMHDIVHDFALQISKDNCFTMNVGQDDKNVEAIHLWLETREGEMVNMSMQGISPKLRTFHLSLGVISNELVKFKYLRTLILIGWCNGQLPTSIGRLKQLRYIDARESRIHSLPPSYKKLYNLQTLMVYRHESSSISLASLINLRHFDVKYGEECMVVGIRQLINLQTLPYFIVGDKQGCKIEELGLLDNLRGMLKIKGLERVKNRKEAQEANLLKKHKINHLLLCWAEERQSLNLNDEDVIEGLEPPPNLKSLEIENFRGSKFPSWMTNSLLQNLVSFKLHGCNSCEHFPSFGDLSFLCSLSIRNCEKFTTLHSLQSLSYLEELHISSVGVVSLPDLPSSLRSLSIENCEKLTTLPLLQSLSSLVELHISFVGVVSLPDMHYELPSLRTLQIMNCTKLDTLSNLLHLCKSIEYIDITYCPALQGVNGYGLENLPCLKNLKIGRISEELDYFPLPQKTSKNIDDTQAYFASLEKLELVGLPQLVSLPEQLQYISTLRELTISWSEELKALPEWLGDIQSLQTLTIQDCANLEYMPSAEAMRRLTNLKILKICSCPRLKERNIRDSSPEWHSIAHTPEIDLWSKEINTKTDLLISAIFQ